MPCLSKIELDTLFRDGVLVVKLHSDEEMMRMRRERFYAHLHSPYLLPEKRREFLDIVLGVKGSNQKLLSAFGAYPFINTSRIEREIEQMQDPVYRQIADRYSRNTGKQFFSFVAPDRSGYRPKGTKQAAESWHRDIGSEYSRRPGHGVIGFGGWISIIGESRFTCVPGSHLFEPAQPTNKNGFCPATAPDPKNVKVFEIPEGYTILFFSSIVHCVTSSASTANHQRQWIAGGITDSAEGNFHDPETIKKHTESGLLSPWKIPSGQDNVYMPRLWGVNSPDKRDEMLKFLDPAYVDKRTRTLLPHAPCEYYPPYSREEAAFYRAHE